MAELALTLVRGMGAAVADRVAVHSWTLAPAHIAIHDLPAGAKVLVLEMRTTALAVVLGRRRIEDVNLSAVTERADQLGQSSGSM